MKFNKMGRACKGDKENRFLLASKFNELLKNPLMCIGLNPSTADENDDDQTTKRIRKIAENQKCDGWIMLNLYPKKSTDPENLKNEEFNEEISKKNIEIIRENISKYKESPILLCWGENATMEVFKKAFKDIFWEIVCKKCFILDIVKNKMPKHPLGAKIENFRELGDKDFMEIVRAFNK
ncbi:hypothetical protein CSA08_05130 [Candidatus Gracilibacteria bacterium]|nr:MAG: hypothetical protein CSA08_05130 [Candidatus Gracilibacteria bacterium]